MLATFFLSTFNKVEKRKRHDVNWEIRTIYVLFNSFNSFIVILLQLLENEFFRPLSVFWLVMTLPAKRRHKKIFRRQNRGIYILSRVGRWKGSTLIAMSRRCLVFISREILKLKSINFRFLLQLCLQCVDIHDYKLPAGNSTYKLKFPCLKLHCRIIIYSSNKMSINVSFLNITVVVFDERIFFCWLANKL